MDVRHKKRRRKILFAAIAILSCALAVLVAILLGSSGGEKMFRFQKEWVAYAKDPYPPEIVQELRIGMSFHDVIRFVGPPNSRYGAWGQYWRYLVRTSPDDGPQRWGSLVVSFDNRNELDMINGRYTLESGQVIEVNLHALMSDRGDTGSRGVRGSSGGAVPPFYVPAAMRLSWAWGVCGGNPEDTGRGFRRFHCRQRNQ